MNDMNVYNHIVFNPHLETIAGVLARLGGNPIWYLHHVVPITEYEWVAVFEAWDGEGNDQNALGKIPLLNDSLQAAKTEKEEDYKS